MSTKLEEYKKEKVQREIPEITTGDTVRIVQNINGKSHPFEGLVIAKKHGNSASSTITIRSVIDKVGVEKVIPVHSPTIEKMEIVKKGRARKAKIYYIREKSKKVAQRKIK